jgi:integrase
MLSWAVKNAIAGTTTWDQGEVGSVKGLHLRVSAKGIKSFYVYYRTKAGQERRPKLGEFPEVTLAEARKRAKALLDKVAIGEDPKGDWDNSRAEMAISRLFELVWEGHWNTPRFTKSGWAKEAKQNYEKNIAPEFENQKLSEVSAKKIRSWHKKMEATPIAANRSLAVLSKMFSFAEENEWISQGVNPCKLVKPHKEKKRKRFASPEEIKKMNDILLREAINNPAGVAFIYLLMFSGARPISIERATWSMLKTVTHEGKVFGVLKFDGKSTAETGEEEIVILPPQAMSVIEKLPRDSDTLTGIKMPKYLWSKIRKEAGCEDLWARDLRRTFATIGMSGGTSSGIIGELLNHKSSETTKIYTQLVPEKRLEATKVIADLITSLLKGG